MPHWSELVKEHFGESIFPNVSLILIGIVGYIAIGGGYLAFQQKGAGKSLTAKGLLADIFPKSQYSHDSSRVDMWTFIPSVLLFAPLAVFVSTVIGLLIGLDISATLAHTFGAHAATTMPVWAIVTLQFGSYMIGHDFGQYIAHYALHRLPFLWAIHRAHHSAETLNFFTNPRAHPIELLILIGSRLLCASVLAGTTFYLTGTTLQPGTTTGLFVYNFIFLGPYTMLTHSHIPVSFGGRFNILIGGPVMHQIHHGADEKHHDKNIGGAPTYIFDWIFGTLYLPEKGENIRYGLNDEEYGESNPHRTVKDFYLEPIITASNELRKFMKRAVEWRNR